MTDPVKYDDVGWHWDSAVEAGYPEENAATHIGLYLGWLIRRDMYEPEFFPGEWVAAIKRGEMTGSEALDSVDNKLVSDLMTDEARAFTDWYYDIYVSDYAHHFADKREWSIRDDALSQGRIEPVIDERFAEWKNLGRPKPSKTPTPEAEPSNLDFGEITVQLTDIYDPGLDDDLRLAQEEALAYAREQGWEIVEPPPDPHDAPDLEALVPTGLMVRPKVWSTSAAHRGDRLLNRSLRRLSVEPQNVQVASGIGSAAGRDTGAISVTLFSVPGVEARQLEDEFSFIHRTSRLPDAGRRTVAGRTVHWDNDIDSIAWWTRDGLVIWAAAPDDEMLVRLIELLP